uniref:Uncharacterized protein n=1 Tax=Parascaris equorum TaxID=6256 RepID=A0A914S258_PAREQ
MCDSERVAISQLQTGQLSSRGRLLRQCVRLC